MKKNKKLWLVSLATLLGTTVPLAAASCSGFNKRRYVYEYNSKIENKPFFYDASRSFGSYLETSTRHQTSVGLIRKATLNEPKIVGILTNDSSGNQKSQRLILEPTWQKNKLELASEIHVTDEHGNIHVFDNDEADIKPEGDVTIEGKKYYSSPSVDLRSDNQRSINSANFDEKMNSAVKVQFVIRKGVKWVDSNGKATKYEVQAKDFYYSWLRTYLIKDIHRQQYGGSKELDDLAAKSVSKDTENYFTSQDSYDNDYLYPLFGIDSSKFLEEDKFLQKLANSETKAVTFEKLPTQKAKFLELFNEIIIKTYELMPAPSQYLDEMNEDAKFKVYNYLGISDDKTKEFEKEVKKLDKSSLAYKSGAYWYAISQKDLLYVGPYYLTPQSGQEQKFKKNKHYWDEAWVKDDNTIEEIVFIYQPTPVDADTFAQRIFNKYKQKSLSNIAFSQLKENQKDEMQKASEKYGLRYIKPLNRSIPYYSMLSQPFVAPLSKNLSQYGFNDAFAKLMYGGTLDELKAGTNDPETYISGTGLVFRTLYNAAINWDQLASEANSGQAKSWIAKVADGSSIGGSNQKTSNLKTPANAENKINSLFAIQADGTKKVDFGKYGDSLEPTENAEYVKDFSDVTEKLKSAGFNQIKEELQKLIDEFDKNNPTLKDKNFEFNYFYPYINITAQQKNAFEQLLKTFKELNPRLDFKLVAVTDSAKTEFNQYRAEGANGANFISWAYDYDSVGSGYDGLSWQANFIPTLTWIAKNDAGDKNKKIQTFYPKLYQLSKDILTYEKQPGNEWVASVPFEDIHLIENRFKGQSLPNVAYYEFKKDSNNVYRLERDANNKAKRYTPAPGKHATDAWEWSSRFWLNYISSKTNEEIVELMTELTSYFNINFTHGIFKSKEEFGRILVQKHFVVPDSLSLGVSVYLDWKVK
ncbi:oligopeptide ABC transporter substrate-binding protein [Mycoplasma enhydrae]|uniref:OppA family ABC transporter substrate-binding lipoprotein n=1 Tax=Mycoplasma enhydrae TaxID=2499220 RepID=UPI0021E7F6F8|nr:oligopeptide ABC transporter substrate-binding protein [Mycoplasma enhydrae]MCV3733859.1 oligopeptide ABC transporter substrate-binding protein [Mycoplasma enhydrae]MCV3753709.1 oligopeptide ABC transporter substrate-binding protein [Mycoplasma enhydrae]